jgi:hypothetical protein
VARVVLRTELVCRVELVACVVSREEVELVGRTLVVRRVVRRVVRLMTASSSTGFGGGATVVRGGGSSSAGLTSSILVGRLRRGANHAGTTMNASRTSR